MALCLLLLLGMINTIDGDGVTKLDCLNSESEPYTAGKWPGKHRTATKNQPPISNVPILDFPGNWFDLTVLSAAISL